MKEWLKRYWFWAVIVLIVVVWNGFMSDSSVMNSMRVRSRIVRHERMRHQYRDSIASDSLFIRNLERPEFLEHIAREKLYMVREGEQIYVID